MNLLTKDEIIFLHELLVEKTGGLSGIRDEGLIISAVESIRVTFDGSDMYPTLIEKAARLAFGLIRNHGFIDGNKRIGVLAMLTTLEINGVFLKYANNDLVALGLGVADGALQYEDIAGWIQKHL